MYGTSYLRLLNGKKHLCTSFCGYQVGMHHVTLLYRSVIEDVINDVRDIFLDDGVDEQVLMELKTVSLPFFFAFLTLFIQKRYSHYFFIWWPFDFVAGGGVVMWRMLVLNSISTIHSSSDLRQTTYISVSVYIRWEFIVLTF